MADMRKYNSTSYIKPDAVREGPLQARIVSVFISEKYDRPVLELDTGDLFTLNATNNRALCQAYGPDSDNWIGHAVEFSLGTYVDRQTDQTKETVKLKALSSCAGNGALQRVDPAQLPAPMAKRSTVKNDPDDEIPF